MSEDDTTNRKRLYTKAGLITAAGLMALSALWFRADLWREHQTESPHYRPAPACASCHVDPNPEETGNAALKTGEVLLCTSCHQTETHGEVLAERKDVDASGQVIVTGWEPVDIGKSHPFNTRPSEKSKPMNLGPYLRMGYMTCWTCHDLHQHGGQRFNLRLGTPQDFTELCHDCHKDY